MKHSTKSESMQAAREYWLENEHAAILHLHNNHENYVISDRAFTDYPQHKKMLREMKYLREWRVSEVYQQWTKDTAKRFKVTGKGQVALKALYGE